MNTVFRMAGADVCASPGQEDAKVHLFEALEARTLRTTTPNDALFGELWGLRAAGAGEAWDVNRGRPDVVVANIDTGIDYTHRDLHRNIWVNQAEIPPTIARRLRDVDHDGRFTLWDLNSRRNRGRVNDVDGNRRIDASDLLAPWNNGQGGWADGVNGATYPGDPYVDDIIGWDFANNDNDPRDRNGHGTHVAGTIGAMGNNRNGVAGVAWKVSMMALKIFPDDAGQGAREGSITAAIRYAANAGARVSNASWGAYAGFGDGVYHAIEYARQRNHVFVVAAGNDGVDNDYSFLRSYPASYNLPNIITVAAANPSGELAYFSNYGKASVHVAAPGTHILSTYLNGTFAYSSGTSMATPHVTGAVALLLAERPDLTYEQVKGANIGTANRTVWLDATNAANGELNVFGSLATALTLPHVEMDDEVEEDDESEDEERDTLARAGAEATYVLAVWDGVRAT